jgi:hypothetical protein
MPSSPAALAASREAFPRWLIPSSSSASTSSTIASSRSSCRAIMQRPTYISLHYQVDLRLVSELTESGLARTECVAYLKVAEAVGATSNEPADEAPLARVRELLSKAQGGA